MVFYTLFASLLFSRPCATPRYGVALLTRNLLLALTPVLAGGGDASQVLLLLTILILYGGLQVYRAGACKGEGCF